MYRILLSFFSDLPVPRRIYVCDRFSICPPVGSHIPFSGRLCMPAPSVCSETPRLSLGHPGSFKSAHDLKCMRMQTAPLVLRPSRKTTAGFEPGTSISTGRRATNELYPQLGKFVKVRDWTKTFLSRACRVPYASPPCAAVCACAEI